MTSTGEWKPRRLGELVKLTSGQSPTGFRFGATGKPYFKVDQLGKSVKYLGRDQTPYLAEDLPQVPAGSVLIAKRGGAIALNRVRVLSEPGFMDTNVMALTPGPEIRSEFLYYWLAYRGLWDIADVTSVPQINNKHIIPLEIRLPERDEQLAIVRALKKADNMVALTVVRIAKKRNIRTGVLDELVTGKTRLHGFGDAWQEVRLRDVGATYGGLTGKDKSDFGTGSGLFVTFTEVMEGPRLRGSRLEQVRVRVGERQNQVERDDVLFNGSSETPEEVALATVVDFDPRPGTFLNSFCFGLRINHRRKVHPAYLAYFFRSSQGRKAVSALAQGATRYNIAKTKLIDLAPLLPPVPEQIAIVQVLRDVEEELEALQRRLASARAIKTGMMQELLTGRTRLPVEVAS